MIENEKPDRRRQIPMLALGVDARHQIGERQIPLISNFFQTSPKGVFKADAGLVSRNDDRPFDYR